VTGGDWSTTLLTDTAGTKIPVCPAAELPDGQMRLVEHDGKKIGVFNCEGTLYAIEDRCSHDDGPLCEGAWDEGTCTVVCPRHGSSFELATGRPLSLPAYQPVETYPVTIVDGIIRVSV
jgi:3-phenylpropionate/trans-cinnamate dioxygenase ferredoxin component